MTTVRLCPLADVAHRLPADSWIAQRLAEEPDALADEATLWITGDAHWPALHLDAPLAPGSPLRQWLHDVPDGPGDASVPHAPFLILVDGDLRIDGALTSADTDGTTHLIVTGNAHLHNAVVGGQLVYVQGALQVNALLWGHYNHGDLRVRGGLQARVALFTDEYHVDITGPEQVEFLLDEVRGVPNRAEFSAEIVGAVFAPEFHEGVDAGEDGLAAVINRRQVLAAVRAGHSAVRSSADIHADQPVAHDLCASDAISIDNILAVVRTPVIAHKEHKAYGWFQQTDFSLCQRHVDDEGDARDDNVFITVWKTWDFYLSVEQVPAPRNWLERVATKLWRHAAPTVAQRTLLYRRYTQGEPGDWKVLAPPAEPDHTPDAWKACEHAWRGVLDYVRKAVGQHRGDDDQKHDGQQAFGVGIARVHQRRPQTLLHERLGGIKHFGRGAAEAINALLGVAHDEDAGRIGSAGIALQPGVQRLPLQRIGVLKFINQQMAHAGIETLLQPAAEGGVLQ